MFIALTALSTHMPLLVLTVGSSSGRHLGAEVARAAHTPARTTPKPRRRVGARRSPRVTVAFADVEVGTASCRMHSAPSTGLCSKPYLNDTHPAGGGVSVTCRTCALCAWSRCGHKARLQNGCFGGNLSRARRLEVRISPEGLMVPVRPKCSPVGWAALRAAIKFLLPA